MTNQINQEKHPNGHPVKILDSPAPRPFRHEQHIMSLKFPDTHHGKLLKGLLVSNEIKFEHRMGWIRMSASDLGSFVPYPNESVASHMFGVARLIETLSWDPEFEKEMPNFDHKKAISMALLHDVPELIVGDITPADNVAEQKKHEDELKAMKKIASFYPETLESEMLQIYDRYEGKKCLEAKFVKDCDRFDFLLTALSYECHGFSQLDEFYTNTLEALDNLGYTNLIRNLAHSLVDIRNDLKEKEELYVSETH